MQATGTIRRVDDLGRIVIPKEVRHRLGIKEGTAMELFIDKEQGLVIFQKYKPEEDLNAALNTFSEQLYNASANEEIEWEKVKEIHSHIKEIQKLLKEIDDETNDHLD